MSAITTPTTQTAITPTTQTMQEPESLIEYPTDFPLKVVGKTQPAFAQTILELVKRHAPDFDESTLGMRPSREGNYLSLTFVIRATSREQLDALYQELSDLSLIHI